MAGPVKVPQCRDARQGTGPSLVKKGHFHLKCSRCGEDVYHPDVIQARDRMANHFLDAHPGKLAAWGEREVKFNGFGEALADAETRMTQLETDFARVRTKIMEQNNERVREIAGLTAIAAAMKDDIDGFARLVQECDTGVEIFLEDDIESESLIKCLSTITRLEESDKKLIYPGATVRVSMSRPETVTERQMKYDADSRIVGVLERQVRVGKLKLESLGGRH
jgi:hypothetical protein